MAINFLPWREKAYIKSQRLFYYTLFFNLSLAIVVLSISYGFFFKHRREIKSQNHSLLKQIEGYQKKNQNKPGSSENDQKHQWLKLTEEKKSLYSFLENLGKIHLKDLYLTQLTWDKNAKILKGVSASMESVFIFIQKIKPFSKVVHFMDASIETEKIIFNLAVEF